MILALAIVCVLALGVCIAIHYASRLDATLEKIDLRDDGYGESHDG